MAKILVRVPQWLGDVVVSTLFLTRLKNKYPGAEIDVLAVPSVKPVFEKHPAVRSVVTLPYSDGGSVWEAARVLKKENYDVAYILPRSFRSALESWLARIPRRIGYKGDLRQLLLTEAIPYDENKLYPHRYLKLIGEENLRLDNLSPYFPKEESDLTRGCPRPFLGIAPSSVAPARTWDADRFAAVARWFIKEKKGTVFLFGSPKEKSVTQSVAQQTGPSVVDTAGRVSLPQLGGLMAQMDAFVGNDSGLMHVASTFKISSVILFGPSDPTWALPPFGRFIPLQDRSISCVPCLRNECVRIGEFYKVCQKSLTPDHVIAALRNFF